ncbi:hypothetical protein [Devosia rhizoryzae]|uniref:Glycosyltransferase RgtA/B/C/D-like domain-containing protein n=1 Tax=Devosia rhizoryzae TaxID=2774137 RepID=A0ABX7C7X2_9HYPH|nr:hypothetical protein [Devosia rhizoryzae]QQR38725.1 hypothetical protein JI748_13290 [Devosia rhizoryzae]
MAYRVEAGTQMGWLNTNWGQVLAIWLALTVTLSVSVIISGVVPPSGGDDVMRLVEAIDLFNGQSWFDTTQYRDNTPYGAPMHWSRLIDAPLVALMALFTPFAQDAAPRWAAFVWPPLVLLAVVALVAEVTERVAGKAARLPALALLAFSIAAYTEFVPGRIDHHNVQLALTLLMILACLEGRFRLGWAVAAGVTTATGLAIGTEILPSLVSALVCFALYWVVDPHQSKPMVLAFAASFAAAVLFHFLLATPPALWLSPACDALSITYLTAAIGYAAAVLIAVSLTPWLRHTASRFVVLAILGCAVLAMVLWLFPSCRLGPYGDLDADLATIYLSEIGEAQPIWLWGSVWRSEIALAVTPILGTIAVLIVTCLVPSRERWRWLVLAGFSAALFIIFCLQIRGFRLLTIAVLPGAAWIVARVIAWFRARQSLGSAVVAGLTLLAFAGATHLYVFSLLFASAPKTAEAASFAACVEQDAYEPLAALPPARLMNYIIIGPQILMRTPHAIVSAGYHRNEQGLRDMISFYRDGEAQARDVAEERDLDYLVFCRGVPATNGLAGLPDFDGHDWPWLKRISGPEEPLQIYAIDLSQQ